MGRLPTPLVVKFNCSVRMPLAGLPRLQFPDDHKHPTDAAVGTPSHGHGHMAFLDHRNYYMCDSPEKRGLKHAFFAEVGTIRLRANAAPQRASYDPDLKMVRHVSAELSDTTASLAQRRQYAAGETAATLTAS